MNRPTRYLLLLLLLTALRSVADTGRLYQPDRLSSGLVTCICQDSQGFIWVGTEYGLNKFDGYRFTHYLHQRGDTTSLIDNEVASLFVDSGGTLWVGCSKGLARYDAENNRFHRYRFPDDRQPRVNALLEAHDGRLLIGTAGYGLYSLSDTTADIHYEEDFNSIVHHFYSRIFIDRRHNLWRSSHLDTMTRFLLKDGKLTGHHEYTSPYGQPMTFIDYSADAMLVVCMYGILRFDYQTGQLADAGFDLSLLQRQGAKGAYIRKALLDPQGNLYIGTVGNGLLVIRRGQKTLERVENSNSDLDLKLSEITDVLQDRAGNLWVGCYNKGLLLLNQQREAFQSWNFLSQNLRMGGSVSSIVRGDGGLTWCTVQPDGVFGFDETGKIVAHLSAPAGVRSLYRDQLGRYWLGTENELYRYRPETGEATAVGHFGGRGINCIEGCDDSHLYVSAYGLGLTILNVDTGEREVFDMNQENRAEGYLCNNWIKQLLRDRHGNLWIATAGGVAMLKPQGRVFNSRGWNSLLPGLQCYSMCEADDGSLLLGTDRGLYRYDPRTDKADLLPDAEPLQDKLICGMVRDDEGTIWLSTTMGIWELQPGRIVAHISGNGLTNKEYIIGTAMQTGGRVFFGTPDGITVFRPSDVHAAPTAMGTVHLTRLTVNGRERSPHQSSLVLSYRENTLGLEFSLLDYRDADNISFEWRTGGSREWHQTGEGNNQIALYELQPGTYDIEVRATNNGEYTPQTRLLHVVIQKPWYRSTLAYLLYALIVAGFVGLVLYNYERQRRRDLEETKMRFLINATHDIRSPLTMIMGAVKKQRELLTGAATGMAPLQHSLDAIDRNAQRLLQLVNQILDERKIDKGQMKLSCQETDLADFIGKIVKLYDYTAQQRNITLTFHKEEEPVRAWIDRIQFDKVVANLLSNAFKYTFDGGEISVELRQHGPDGKMKNGYAEIVVADTGLGFDDDKTDRFFERFYQGKGSKDLHIDGTGIGLNLSRAITELHGGTISAANRRPLRERQADGQTEAPTGAILTVILPLGKDHLKPDEIEQTSTAAAAAAVHPARQQANRHLRILVVDDDVEIASYIASELGQWYRFDHAENGREALKLLLAEATANAYDLVVSDVMMPEMDGLTLLRSIKQNPQLSDIPVILLTSKSEVAFRLEGLKKGADAYLAKPFSMEELHILIDNLVDNVRRLRGKFSGASTQQSRVEQVEVKGNNDALMERVMRVVNDNLSNPDFSIEQLTREVGISRAQLHRKMKEITGISTSEFIRNLRLEQAARLIREKKVNITQVAYSVGFNNQAHFSTIFKKHFGVTPTEYADS